MKQLTKTLSLLVVALITAANMWAAPGWQEVANYKEDFSNASVSGSKFTNLADYWSVLGTGAVWAMSSGAVGTTQDLSANTTDFLVTPQVKGNVTLKAKYCYWGARTYAHITVYEAEDNDGVIVPGDRVLDESLEEVSSMTQFTIASGSADFRRYVIHISGGYIDDFAASSAYINVPESRVLTPTAITGEWSDSNPIYADASGCGEWTGTITVKNEGNVDLNPGDENFSLAVASQSTYAVTTTMSTFAIPEALAVGEEKTFDVAVPVKLANATADGRTAIRFTTNLLAKGNTATSSASYRQSTWFTLKTVAPNLYVRNASSNNVESYATELGLVSAPASTTFTLRNDGGSSVLLRDIVSTFENATWSVDGAEVVYPYEIAKGETKTFTLTLNNTGGQASTLTFKYGNTYDDTEYELVSREVSAVVADPSLYLENFDSYLTVPDGWCQPGWVNEPGSNWSFSSSSYNTFATNSTQAFPGKYLISPKLTFAEGQALTVSAVPSTTYTSNDSYLKVLYSTDRQNWEVANIIAFNSSKPSVEGIEDKLIEWGTNLSSDIAKAKAYVVSGIPAGDYYIGFEAGYSKIDYIFGGVKTELDNDFYVSNIKVESERGGMVNYPVTVTVDYTNMLDHASKAHKVILYNNDEPCKQVEGAALEAYADAEPVVFTYVPYANGACNFRVGIAVEEDSYEASSAVVPVNVRPENAEAIAQVGEGTAAQNTPLGHNYKRYRAEWIWTADELGISAGTDITSLTLKYYSTSKDVTKKAKVYFMSTDDKVVEGNAFTPVAEITPNYTNDEFVMLKAGSSEEYAEMTFAFDNVYTYDGRNIRVVMDFNGDNYTSAYFECRSGKALTYRADGTTETKDEDNASSASYIPVGYVGYAIEVPVFSGVITDVETGSAVAGAKVVISGSDKDIRYSGVTDENGEYSFAVFQKGVFNVETTADDYVALAASGVKVEENTAENYALVSKASGKVLVSGNADVATTEQNDASVIFNRTFAAGWSTICVPFEVSDIESVFGIGVKVQTLTQSNDDEGVTLDFYRTSTIQANKPYLIYFPAAVTEPLLITANVKASVAGEVEVADVIFKGNYAAYKDMEGFYGVSDAHLKLGVEGSFLRSTHAYFEALADLSDAKIVIYDEEEGTATGLDEIFGNTPVEFRNIYDLQGRKVEKPSNGIFIVNGKKVVMK